MIVELLPIRKSLDMFKYSLARERILHVAMSDGNRPSCHSSGIDRDEKF